MIAYVSVDLAVERADIESARPGQETNPIALAAKRHFGFDVAARSFSVRRVLDRSRDGEVWGETVAILPIETDDWLWNWQEGRPTVPTTFRMEVRGA